MKFLYQILGVVINYIDIGIFTITGKHSIGWCIIAFTIIVYALMIPLNAKQQKSTRLMNKINPELQAIRDKYQGKKDNDSVMKMNNETQAIYTKYGISPFTGCLPMLITLPIMFAIYGVIRNVQTYAPGLSDESAKMFLGLDVTQTPREFSKVTIFAYLIPILAVIFQYLNVMIMQPKTEKKAGSRKKDSDDSMQQSMKMMNYFMPLMSGFFCLTLNIGIGLYWIIGSIFRVVQGYLINRHVENIDLDDLIEKNKDKVVKKAKKQEEMNRRMEEYSKTRTSGIQYAKNYKNDTKDTNNRSDHEKVMNTKNRDNNNSSKDFKKGSISYYAHKLDKK